LNGVHVQHDRLKNASRPVRVFRRDRDDGEPVMLPLHCNAFRVIDVQIDTERGRVLCRTVATNHSIVSILVDDPFERYAKALEPAPQVVRGAVRGGVDPELTAPAKQFPHQRRRATPESLVVPEPTPAREEWLRGHMGGANQRVIHVEGDPQRYTPMTELANPLSRRTRERMSSLVRSQKLSHYRGQN